LAGGTTIVDASASPSGHDYTSLSGWEAGEAGSLTEDCIARCKSDDNADTAKCTISGWTAGSYDIQIEAYDSANAATASGYKSGCYRLEVNGSCFLNYEDNVCIGRPGYGIQGKSTSTSSNMEFYEENYGIGSTTIKIDSCYFIGNGESRFHRFANLNNDTSPTYEIKNNIAEDVTYFVFIASDFTVKIYNNSYEGDSQSSTTGVYISSGADTSTVTIKNNAFFNCADDIDDNNGGAAPTIDYNATDDGDGTNSVSPSDWTDVFEGYTTGDYRLKSTDTDLQGAGVGNGTDSDVPTADMDGNDRGTGPACDIGAFEYVAAGGAPPPTSVIYGPLVGPMGGPI